MRDEERSEYGQRLLAARMGAGLRQVDLAAKAGISQGTLADLEKQGRASKFTAQLAMACGVRPQWLASGEGPMEEPNAWPFRTVTLSRFLALSPEDRAYVEGKFEAAIESRENSVISTNDERGRFLLPDPPPNSTRGAAPETSTLSRARVGGDKRAGSTAGRVQEPRRHKGSK